jgi:colanic acid biosynthesis glycosyl transferase WcaI
MARVLIHTLVFPPDGVSTAYLMGDLAVDLEAAGHEVTVLTTTPHYNIASGGAAQELRPVWPGLLYRSEMGGIRVLHVRVPMKGNRVIRRGFDFIRFHLVSALAGMTLIGSQDVVIAPSPPLTIGVVAWWLARVRGAKAVYNVQELYPDFAVNQGVVKQRWLIGLLRGLERLVYRLNDVVVSISPWFNRIIEARGVPPEKLRMIPNFADTEFYRPLPRRNPFSREHGLDDTFVVLYGGNIGLSQDWESLLLAAERLRKHPIVFVILGDGVRRRWLEDEVQRRDLRNVRILGYQPKERVPEIHATSDLCTIPMKPGTTSDTFPSKIYTIMACARPVLVQADPGSELESVVHASGCGVVVPAGDPEAFHDGILEAYENRGGLAAAGESGRTFVLREYSRAAIGKKYSELIAELIGTNSRSADAASSMAGPYA